MYILPKFYGGMRGVTVNCDNDNDVPRIPVATVAADIVTTVLVCTIVKDVKCE